MSNQRVSRVLAFGTICGGALLIGSLLAARGPAVLAAEPTGLRVSVGGRDVPSAARLDVRVDQVVHAADLAVVALGGHKGRKFADGVSVGDDLEVEAPLPSRGSDAFFKGEVVGIEPVFDARGETRVVIRAFNRLHRLNRGRKSRTFENVTDAEIVTIIAQENGLAPQPSGDVSIRYDHVFQHNQTDLDFLRERAKQIGHEVFVDDTTLVFRKKLADTDPPIVLAPRRSEGDARLRRFLPRLSSAANVQIVTVRGFDPQSGEEVTGQVAAPTILLTGEDGEPAHRLAARYRSFPTPLSLRSKKPRSVPW